MIWWQNTTHFGWRGRDEHRRACYGDFHFAQDEQGCEYVEWQVERGTKTRTGVEGQTERAFNARMYSTGTERCPVALIKKYLSLRPPDLCLPESPQYLQEAPKCTETLWYKRQPVGREKLGNFMKTMATAAGLQGRKTNHSARKTMCVRLITNDVTPTHVAQLSGHKNLKCLDSLNDTTNSAVSLPSSTCNAFSGLSEWKSDS